MGALGSKQHQQQHQEQSSGRHVVRDSVRESINSNNHEPHHDNIIDQNRHNHSEAETAEPVTSVPAGT